MPEVVLVAGRGPMAARAIRSCQTMGAKAVAVYSEADVNAPHVRMADDSLLIGAAAPESSYLDIAALVEAALVSGAQAILPVHAVLGGSVDLARGTREAGLVWVGADPDAVESIDRSGWGVDAPEESEFSGWVMGLADGYRIDGLVVRRSASGGAKLCWTSAVDSGTHASGGGSLAAAAILATVSDLVVELGWQGLVSVAFGPDGQVLAVRGGVPTELGLVEFRSGRDLIQAALALSEGATPPSGSSGAPAAVGAAVRATAVPGLGQRASIDELVGPVGDGILWEPGYASGDPLWSCYDPVLAVVGVRGESLAAAATGFLEATAGVRVAGVPNDLGQLRAQAEDLAARLRDGSA